MSRFDDGQEPEAEPVVVDTDRRGVVVLELEDGSRLMLDAVELRSALGVESSVAA